MQPVRAVRALFVVPRWRGLPTGGNLYNEGLLRALAARGLSFERCEFDQVTAACRERHHDWLWFDSLYFERLVEVRARLSPLSRLGLMLHALPSSLAEAAGQEHEPLVRLERAWLRSLDCVLTTSSTTRALVEARAPGLCTWTVEPAIRGAATGPRTSQPPLCALMIANLTVNKGVLPWLRALAVRVRADDAFVLRCVGRFDADPEYARACREQLEQSAALSARVVLTGMQSEAQVLEELARAHVLVSASRTESFGMAVADARASGCLVIARAGGHIEALVDAQAGGIVVQDDQALVDAFLALVRDPRRLHERLVSAARSTLAERSWDDAARDFLAHAHTHAWPRNAQ